MVIAVFYTDRIDAAWLAGALGGLALIAVLRRARVWYAPLYVVAGIAVWLCTLKSGVHATIAGVALGLLTPARPLMPELEADQIADQLSSDTEVTAAEVRTLGFALRESVSPAERLEDALHPWTSYVIIPIFALANAGIVLSADALSDAASSAITAGVVVGLVAGKLIGISAFMWLAVRLGAGRLPDGVSWRHITGMAAVAGIGFTVSIFVSGLAYTDVTPVDQAKIGVLVASALAAAIGSVMLLSVPNGTKAPPAEEEATQWGRTEERTSA